MTPREVLDRHVDNFNYGVRTGDFGPMLEHLTEDAVMTFEGMPVGPFAGRAAIKQAYDRQPPDDTLRILDVNGSDDELVATYAWGKNPERAAGAITVVVRDGHITRLTITFGAPAGA